MRGIWESDTMIAVPLGSYPENLIFALPMLVIMTVIFIYVQAVMKKMYPDTKPPYLDKDTQEEVDIE
jgi:hypothetical protein